MTKTLNRYQKNLTNNKKCFQCGEVKFYKDFRGLDKNKKETVDICKQCEKAEYDSKKQEAINSSTKQCKECNQILDKSKYRKDPKGYDGCYNICNPCINAKNAGYGKKKYNDLVTQNFKECSQCKESKMFKDFVAESKNGLIRRNICRSCEKTSRKNKVINTENKTCGQCKQTLNKKEFTSDSSRIDGLYGVCKECKSKNDKQWKENNPKKVKELNIKRMSIPQNKIAHNMRSRLGYLVKNKKNSTFDYIGINTDDFFLWLEYQFDENMTWDNYGNYWEIDHVKPCSSFDLTNEEEIYKCFNWKNMRPLEKTQNNSKNNKILYDDIKKHYCIVNRFMEGFNL